MINVVPDMLPCPSVSVIMPVFNSDAFLAEAIDSVLRQQFHDFELILIDDGSTDTSFEIMQQYSRADERIRIIRQSNAGLPTALNAGIAASRAPLIARMDGDDIMLDDRLERQVEFMRQHPCVSVVSCCAYHIGISGNRIGQTTDFLKLTDANSSTELARQGKIIWCLHPGVLMRKADLLEVGGYDERWQVGEDVDLWNRMADRGLPIIVLPDFLMEYRVHNKTITNKSFSTQWDLFSCMIENIHRRRENKLEISYHEFLQLKKSWSILQKLRYERRRIGALLTRNAECYYAEQQLGYMGLTIAKSFMIQPRVAFRTLKNFT